jgi:hypothetical protein
MRTTVRLPDELLAEAKKAAAEGRTTLNAVIEDAVRAALARRGGGAPPQPVRLTTFGRGGVRPGIDLDDSASLLEAMEAVGNAG